MRKLLGILHDVQNVISKYNLKLASTNVVVANVLSHTQIRG